MEVCKLCLISFLWGYQTFSIIVLFIQLETNRYKVYMSNTVLYNFSKTVFSVSSGSLKTLGSNNKYVELDYLNSDKTSVLKLNEVNYFPLSLSLVKKETQFYCIIKTTDNINDPTKYLYLAIPIVYSTDAASNDLDLALNSITSTSVNGVLVDLNSWLKPAQTSSNIHTLYIGTSQTIVLSTPLSLKSNLINGNVGTESAPEPEISTITPELSSILPSETLVPKYVSFQYQPLTTIMDCQPTTGIDKNDVSFAKVETMSDKDIMNKVIMTFIMVIAGVVAVALSFNTIYFYLMVKLANSLIDTPEVLNTINDIEGKQFPLRTVNIYWALSLGLMSIFMLIFGIKFNQGSMVTAAIGIIVGIVCVGYLYSNNELFTRISDMNLFGALFKGKQKYLGIAFLLFVCGIIIPMSVFMARKKSSKVVNQFQSVMITGFVYLFLSHAILQSLFSNWEGGKIISVILALLLVMTIVLTSLSAEGKI